MVVTIAVYLLFMQLDDPVHDWYVPAFHLEDKDLTSLQWFILVVGQEEKVPSIECGLHTTTGWIERGNFLFILGHEIMKVSLP